MSALYLKRLHELSPGECGEIELIEDKGAVTQRLMALAMLPGATVRVMRVAPFGDPIMLRVGESRISMRREDAARVLIKV